jgi:ABC-2 type transport system ATP-binding protein
MVAGTMSPAVVLEGVAKRFGAKVALSRIDLTVKAGEVSGFIGPNGSGKTTMLRVLLGLIGRDAGSVSVLGLDPRADPAAVRAQVGVLLDHDGHYDRLTAHQNLTFHARAHGLDANETRARVEASLKECGLWDRAGDRVLLFSKGMRQKLAVARALLHRPKLVLLDEPFTGLDPAAAIELRDRLRALTRDHGTTVLLTTHDLHHVERACDHVTVIRAGQTLAAGTTSELLARAGGDVVEVIVAGEGALVETLETMRAEGLLLAFTRAELADRMIVSCTETQRKTLGTELVRRGIAIEELSPRRVTLEERFVSLVSVTEEKSS